MAEPIKPEDCPEPQWHKTHRYCPICSWVETPDREARRLERCAIAAYHAFQHDVASQGRIQWEAVPEEVRVTFRAVADCVLMAGEMDD